MNPSSAASHPAPIRPDAYRFAVKLENISFTNYSMLI